MKILIADDDKYSRLLLNTLLCEKHQLEEATNGLEALDKINTFNPDLVLLDILMPEITTLKRIRENYLIIS